MHEAPQKAKADGLAFVVLDGKIFSTDRCDEKPTTLSPRLWNCSGYVKCLQNTFGFSIRNGHSIFHLPGELLANVSAREVGIFRGYRHRLRVSGLSGRPGSQNERSASTFRSTTHVSVTGRPRVDP